VDTLNEEIISLIKRLPKAESETPSVHGLTELELTCGKILDRLLIACGHGRPPIRIQIGKRDKTSRFEFNQNDYPKDTVLLREYEYNGYFIREFEQEPCEKWKKMMLNDDDSALEERGEGGYEVLDSNGKIIEEDWYGMGDSATDNAENEVDWLVRGDIADKLGLDISGKTSVQVEKLFNETGECNETGEWTVKKGEQL